MTRSLLLLALLWSASVLAAGAPDAPTPSPAGAAALPADAAEQELLRAILGVRQDIERDTDALNRLHSTIAEERTALAGLLDALRGEVAADRQELDRLGALQREGERERRELAAEVEALEAECRVLVDLFREYGRAAGTRVSLAEAPQMAAALGSAGEELERARVEPERLPEAGTAMLEVAAEWNQRRLGGHQFGGRALDQAGLEHVGDFGVWGPVVYFRSAAAGPTGPVSTQFGSLLPLVDGSREAAVRSALGTVLEGGEALLPVDTSGGDALRISRARASWVEHVRQGGFVMVPILGVGLLAAVLALWKVGQLWRMKIGRDPGVAEVMTRLRAGDVEGARARLELLRAPVASLLREGFAHAHLPRAQLEEILHEHILRLLPRLERHLGTLAVVGGVAPLLGLLGTVTGMIHTFQMVTLFGSGDARLLSGGISEALITTEFGLAIAIPVLLVHAFLARRARAVISALEETALAFVNHLAIGGGGAG